MQNSNPVRCRASMTSSDSGGSRSEKRVVVKALFGLSGESAAAGVFMVARVEGDGSFCVR